MDRPNHTPPSMLSLGSLPAIGAVVDVVSTGVEADPLVVVALQVVVGGLPTVSSTEAASREVAAVL